MNKIELLRTESIEQIIGLPPRALITSSIIVYASIIIFSFIILLSIGYPNIRRERVSLYVDKTAITAAYHCSFLVAIGDGRDIRVNQKVMIKLNGYDVEKYGAINGMISQKVLQDGQYHVDITLPEGLTTNSGNRIVYQDGLTGTADIITGKVKLLTKILNSHRYF